MKLKFYPFILTAILAVINIFLLYRVINFDNKYEVLNSTLHKVLINKKVSPSEIEIQKFKEESYIRQQERDTTLILTVFALFAGFTAFLTFRSFSSKVEEYTAIIDKKYADHEAKNEEQHRRLSKLEIDLSYQLGAFYFQMAKEELKSNNKQGYMNYLLGSAEKSSFILNNQYEENELFIAGTYNFLIKMLKDMLVNAEGLEPINLQKTHSFERYRKKIQEIEQALKTEDFHLVSKVNLLFTFSS